MNNLLPKTITPHIHNDALHEAIPPQWHVDDLALQHSNCP